MTPELGGNLTLSLSFLVILRLLHSIAASQHTDRNSTRFPRMSIDEMLGDQSSY
jgi:hypothetical protein